MRYSESRLAANSEMGPVEVRQFCQQYLDDAARSLLKLAVNQLALSARSFHRVLKVARTIADLAGEEVIVCGARGGGATIPASGAGLAGRVYQRASCSSIQPKRFRISIGSLSSGVILPE